MKKNKKIPYTPKYKFGGFEKTIFTPDKDDKQKIKKFGKQAGTAAYGVGEGLLDTVTMGATDQLTDQGYYALQKAGNSTQDEMREQDSIRGFSNAAGAIGGAIINPGATGTAISQTGKGLGAGISKGNESKEWAAGAGMALNTAGQIGAMAYGQAGSPMSSEMQTQAGNFNASGFGQGLDKYNKFANQGGGSGQMGGMFNSFIGGSSGGMGAGFMPNLPSGTPPFAMKYGGQMKFAMGGMNMKPNAEVEGGGYGKDGENTLNPDNTATQFNGPTHEQGGIQTNLDPGTLIFSNKIKWDGKTAADHNKPYAKIIQKANKDLENSNLSKESKLSSHLNLMGATKVSQAIFAQMEAKKQAMVQNYAKKMGVTLPQPSMDNEQMEPQGMSEQSEGEMTMARHGGMMNYMANGGMIKRADGSYSKRGLWDNIRANAGSGKTPTAEMLEQEAKINASYKEGGIHINPANKGKFTASAQRAGMGVQEFANHVLANKEDYSSTQVKRANFAHNAAGWKHAMGGVQLPYYNTDNAGNPIYAMGGGYPAMTNPYYNFKGSIPMYEDGAITPFNFKPANQSYQFGRARFLSNGQLDQTDPLARVKMNIDNNTEKPYMGNSNYISPEDEYNRDLAAANARVAQEVPGANKPNWMDIVGKGVNFAAQNMGNIYDLSRKDAPLQSYERATAKYLDPTQARRDEQYAYRQANKAIPGLVGGSGGAAMNLLGANRARTSTNIGRINKEYENANAQIGNQLNQYNTEIAYREAEARAKDAAMKENIRSQALHGIGTSVGKATKSGKQDVMDQKTLEMYKQYYNNPQFRAALKKAGYDV